MSGMGKGGRKSGSRDETRFLSPSLRMDEPTPVKASIASGGAETADCAERADLDSLLSFISDAGDDALESFSVHPPTTCIALSLASSREQGLLDDDEEEEEEEEEEKAEAEAAVRRNWSNGSVSLSPLRLLCVQDEGNILSFELAQVQVERVDISVYGRPAIELRRRDTKAVEIALCFRNPYSSDALEMIQTNQKYAAVLASTVARVESVRSLQQLKRALQEATVSSLLLPAAPPTAGMGQAVVAELERLASALREPRGLEVARELAEPLGLDRLLQVLCVCLRTPLPALTLAHTCLVALLSANQPAKDRLLQSEELGQRALASAISLLKRSDLPHALLAIVLRFILSVSNNKPGQRCLKSLNPVPAMVACLTCLTAQPGEGAAGTPAAAAAALPPAVTLTAVNFALQSVSNLAAYDDNTLYSFAYLGGGAIISALLYWPHCAPVSTALTFIMDLCRSETFTRSAQAQAWLPPLARWQLPSQPLAARLAAHIAVALIHGVTVSAEASAASQACGGGSVPAAHHSPLRPHLGSSSSSGSGGAGGGGGSASGSGGTPFKPGPPSALSISPLLAADRPVLGGLRQLVDAAASGTPFEGVLYDLTPILKAIAQLASLDCNELIMLELGFVQCLCALVSSRRSACHAIFKSYQRRAGSERRRGGRESEGEESEEEEAGAFQRRSFRAHGLPTGNLKPSKGRSHPATAICTAVTTSEGAPAHTSSAAALQRAASRAEVVETDLALGALLHLSSNAECVDIMTSCGLIGELGALAALLPSWRNVGALQWALKPGSCGAAAAPLEAAGTPGPALGGGSGGSSMATSGSDAARPRHCMLSYCWANQARVLEVRAELRRRGVACWIDTEQMAAANNMLDGMASAVEAAHTVLVFVSRGYSESGPCRMELQYAKQLKVRIVPVIVEAGYRPMGWLALAISGLLYFDILRSPKNLAALLEDVASKAAAECAASACAAAAAAQRAREVEDAAVLEEGPVALSFTALCRLSAEGLGRWLAVWGLQPLAPCFDIAGVDGKALAGLASVARREGLGGLRQALQPLCSAAAWEALPPATLLRLRAALCAEGDS